MQFDVMRLFFLSCRPIFLPQKPIIRWRMTGYIFKTSGETGQVIKAGLKCDLRDGFFCIGEKYLGCLQRKS